MIKARFAGQFFFCGFALFLSQPLGIADVRSPEELWCSEIIARDSPLSAPLMVAALGADFGHSTVRTMPTALMVQSDSTFDQALKSAGIESTGQSLELIKYLNPQYAKSDYIPKSTQLFLPTFEIYKDASWTPAPKYKGLEINSFNPNYIRSVMSDVNKPTIDNFEELHLIAKGTGKNLTDIDTKSTQARFIDEIVSRSKVNFDESISSGRYPDINKTDSLISAWDKANFAAGYLIQNQNEGASIPIAKSLTQWAMADFLNVSENLIRVSILPEDNIGNKIDNLTVRYMSKAAFELNCPKVDAFRFATKSYNATQMMRRASWYIWIEKEGNSLTKPILFDFTTVNEFEFIDTILVN
jgi:hypothetical protein